jgi:hypothetical protein
MLAVDTVSNPLGVRHVLCTAGFEMTLEQRNYYAKHVIAGANPHVHYYDNVNSGIMDPV